mmetsp:Transcript_9783/g.15314  ORF Transcript_9783/g.15314 Transcript_9783/m.15314 type:complete len:232 (+) Transcript_9783:54-749(+)
MACCCDLGDGGSDPLARICKVSDGLYISGCMALLKWEELKRKGVTHILNMIGGQIYQERFMGGTQYCYFPNDFKYKILATNDNVDQDLSKFFPETSAFIEEGIQAGGVLVHCYAGVSRSSTAICAYLIERRGKTLEEALAMVKSGRPEAKPNVSFMEQLKRYDQKFASLRIAQDGGRGPVGGQIQANIAPPQSATSMHMGMNALQPGFNLGGTPQTGFYQPQPGFHSGGRV